MDTEDRQKRIEEEMNLLIEIKQKMSIAEPWALEDARAVYNKIQLEEKTEPEKKKIAKNNEKKKGLELGSRYDFTEKQGQATNKQLEFIQVLRKKAKEGELKISISVDNVPKMKYEEADNEIKRLKEKLGWPNKEEKDS